MAVFATHQTNIEPAHLVALRALVYTGTALVAVVPLADGWGIAAAALAAATGVVAARWLAASRFRWPWICLASALLAAFGLLAETIFGSWTVLAELLGPGRLLTWIDVLTFGSLTLGVVLGLRTLSQRWAVCALFEALGIAAMIAFSFRAHRQYPFSQPQLLSDWAFLEGYDPRNVLMMIGVATLIGVGLLLLPRQSLPRTLFAACVLLLLGWLATPLLLTAVNEFLNGQAAHARASQSSRGPPQAGPAKTGNSPDDGQPPKGTDRSSSGQTPQEGDSVPRPARPKRPPPPAQPHELPPLLSIDDVQILEGNAGTTAMTFTVSLSARTDKQVKVNYRTGGGTANPDNDYTPAQNTLVIPAGRTKARITVHVSGDTEIEPDETVLVTLSSPVHALLKRERGLGVIVNDDFEPPPVELSIDDAQVKEGNVGITPLAFTLTLSATTTRPVEVNFETITGTAKSDEDFRLASGKATIPVGEKSAMVSIDVFGDLTVEADETFVMRLSKPTGAVLKRAEGTGTIINDDFEPPPPTLTISDVRVLEGNAGTTAATFAVVLSEPVNKPVEVKYQTIGGTAKPGEDFHAIEGTVTLPPGQTRAVVSVEVVGDTVVEPDETFVLRLQEPVNAVLVRNEGTGTIINDDSDKPPPPRPPKELPTLTIEDAKEKEGNAGMTPLTFRVTLSEATNDEVRVHYATKGGSAVEGQDFHRAEGTLTIPPGTTQATFVVQLVGDTTVEPDETFEVALTEPVHAAIKRQPGIGTIENDDQNPALPTLTVDDVKLEEGNAGFKPFAFRVALSFPSRQEVKVDYQANSRTATRIDDYAITGGTLTFPPGATQATVTVNVVGDTDEEPDEIFTVDLFKAVNAQIARSSGIGTIVNDDHNPTPPGISIGDVSVDEGDAGTTPAKFTIKLSAPTKKPVKVSYTTVEGTAKADIDFRARQGVVTIPAGQTEASVTVDVLGNNKIEPDKDFQVRLSNPIFGALERSLATGTIKNDDHEPPPPALSVDDVKQSAPEQGTTEFKFSVHVSEPSDKPIEVKYSTGGGTSQPDKDYQSTQGTLTIPPGQTKAEISVKVSSNSTSGEDQSFVMQLSAPQNAVLDRDQAQGTIENKTPPPSGKGPPEDEFDWAQTGQGEMSPALLVKFRADYEPVEKGYYFRMFAYSKMVQSRMLRDETLDTDIVWTMPTQRLSLPSRVPSDILRDLPTTVYLIGKQETVSSLTQAVAFEPTDVPTKVKEFSAAFNVTSQVLCNSRRDGKFLDAYSDVAAASAGDPSWDEKTRNHYLAIPDDPRYGDLAREIAGTLSPQQRKSAFARAMAVRKWMGDNLTYDYDPSHRQAKDRTASFLFGNHHGYCIHLAHSMTWLLRAQNIPARLASGYRVSAERRGERGSLLVYSADLHAWAEMYLDGLGWIVVESATNGSVPHPSKEPDPKELDRYLSLLGDVPPDSFDKDESLFGSLRDWLWLWTIVALIVLVVGLYSVKLWRQLVPRFAGAAALHRVGYRAVLDLLAGVGMRRRYGETWDEFAARLGDVSADFAQLTAIHLHRTFSTSPGTNENGWQEVQTRVKHQIAAKVSSRRLWLGRLNPFNWIGVG